jgi:hemerythrin-like metal-binding protein
MAAVPVKILEWTEEYSRKRQYTLDHFAHEEELMAAVHYPEFQAHLQQHDELRCKARGFGERFECGETTMTIELAVFLAEWIKQHTMTTDRRLGEYLSSSGRVPAPGGSFGRRHR